MIAARHNPQIAMTTGQDRLASNSALFILYVAAVLTVAMVLFPPFASLNGTEYAFVLSGPIWSSNMGALGENLGLTARIHWALLVVQLGAVWAIALGGKFFLGRRAAAVTGPLLILLSYSII